MMPAPLPSQDDMAMARTSPDERGRVDAMYAKACGLVGGAVAVFCERVALFDVRERGREIAEATQSVDHARLDRDLAEFWERYPVAVERPTLSLVGGRISRRLPRARPAA